MKNTSPNTTYKEMHYAPAGEKRFEFLNSEFRKKDIIIKGLEIGAFVIITAVVGIGMYKFL